MITLHNQDCLEFMAGLPDNSIDMCLTDPPYGTTTCGWDSIISFEPMWEQLKRIVKPQKAIALFGAEPFSSHLRLSNQKWFKYDWIWSKSRTVGFTNAKNKPLNKCEIISIFSDGTTANRSNRRMVYYPQGLLPYGKTQRGIRDCEADAKSRGHKFARPCHKAAYIQEFTNYPTQLLEIASEGKTVHPTQKPIALLEYLIKTYTLEGETVLDFTFGSGSTAVACRNTGRNFIGCELDLDYFNLAKERLAQPHLLSPHSRQV